MANHIEITFDTAHYFYVGSMVKGTVLVAVTSPQKYSTISINLIAKAEVSWSENQPAGLKRTNRTAYGKSVTYINAQRILWTKEYSPTEDLPVGSHAFPFEFQLPQDTPPSFEGEYGWMRYEFGVTASRDKQPKPGYATKARLDVRDRMDLSKLHQQPKSLDGDKNISLFWYNVGTVISTCSVPRTGFSPGDNIPVNLHIANQTSRTIHASASLYRKDSFVTPNKVKTMESRVAKVVSPQISAGQLMAFHSQDLVVPEDAATTIQNCSCIGVEYSLVIKIVIPWSFNRTLQIPVVINNQLQPCCDPKPEINNSGPTQTVDLVHTVLKQKMGLTQSLQTVPAANSSEDFLNKMAEHIEITLDSSEHLYVGSIMKGRVLVAVTTPQKYTNISIDLWARAEVDWSESQPAGLGRTKRVTYSNSHTYVKAQRPLWTKEYSPTDDLPIGSHAFPFEFQLPQGTPASFEGEHGWMRYELGVTAVRDGHVRPGYATKTYFNVKGKTDLAKMYKEPKSLDVDKNVSFFWHNVGTVIATCSIPRTGFSPGENVPVNLHIVNQTSRTVHASVSLYRKDSFITPTKEKRIEKRITKDVSPQIGAGQLMAFHSQDLVIPKDAVNTIENCSCISVEYSLVIKIVIPWSFNRTLHIPVKITHQTTGVKHHLQTRHSHLQNLGLL